jgi:hypothetical protein
MGFIKIELVKVICPVCGEQVDAKAWDGRVKGYCATAKKVVDFPVEKQGSVETKVETSIGQAPIRADRDSRGHFIKGNMPLNKKAT